MEPLLCVLQKQPVFSGKDVYIAERPLSWPKECGSPVWACALLVSLGSICYTALAMYGCFFLRVHKSFCLRVLVWNRLVWNVSWSFSKTPETSGMTMFCFSVSSPTFLCLWSLQVQSQSEGGGGGSWWLPACCPKDGVSQKASADLCVCWVPVYFDDEASIRTDVNCAV